MLRTLSITALALALAACASEPQRGGRGPHRDGFGPGRERPPRTRLFLSPSGEPFRGENGLAAWFAQADTDHDGALSRAEFEADALRFFKVLDANGDGQIDGFEIQAYERERVPELGQADLLEGPSREAGERGGGMRRGGGGMGGGGGGRRGGMGGGGQQGSPLGGEPVHAPAAGREGAARYSLLNEPEPVANADDNVDGRVSLAEWKRATARRFERLDRAKTGRLILSDLILPAGARRSPPKP